MFKTSLDYAQMHWRPAWTTPAPLPQQLKKQEEGGLASHELPVGLEASHLVQTTAQSREKPPPHIPSQFSSV